MVAPWLIPAAIGLGVGAGGGALLGGGSEQPSFEDFINQVAQAFGPGGPFAMKSGQTPRGTASAGGGSVDYGTVPQFVDFSKLDQNKSKILKNIERGKFGKGKAPGVKSDLQTAIKTDPSKVSLDLLKPFKGLTQKVTKKGIVSGKPNIPDVDFEANPQSQTGYDFLQGDYLNNLKNQQIINSMVASLVPKQVGFAGNVIDTGNRFLNTGFSEVDPAVQTKIDAAKNAYLNNYTRNLKDKYSNIADSIFTSVAESGVSGSGTGGAFRRDVYDPLAEEVANAVNLAELYARDEGHRFLEDQRTGFATVASSAPGYNAVTQNINIPRLLADPYLLGPNGIYGGPEAIINAIQYANTYGQNADTIRRQPGVAALSQGGQFFNQGPSVAQGIGSLTGTIAPAAISAYATLNNPMATYFANLIAQGGKK